MRVEEAFDCAEEAFDKAALPVHCPVKAVAQLFAEASFLALFLDRRYAELPRAKARASSEGVPHSSR